MELYLGRYLIIFIIFVKKENETPLYYRILDTEYMCRCISIYLDKNTLQQ